MSRAQNFCAFKYVETEVNRKPHEKPKKANTKMRIWIAHYFMGNLYLGCWGDHRIPD